MRYDYITDKLLHVVGWEQDPNPARAIEGAMLRSESGLTFQGAHPLVTLANVRATMPDDYWMRYPEWNALKEYHEGDKVKFDNVVFVAIADNQGIEPNSADFNGDFSKDYSTEVWKPFNFVSNYVENLTRQSIAQTIQKFLNEKQLRHETRPILEQRTFFDGAGRRTDAITNNGKMVGFEIVPIRANGVTTIINEVGFQFTTNASFDLYLFHSSSIHPQKTWHIDYTGNGSFQWVKIDASLPYRTETTNSGGAWFLVYNQNDLPDGCNAIRFVRDWSKEPCGTCNRGNLETWRELTKYIQVSPFNIHAAKTFNEFPEMWDLAEICYTNTINYGMNCRVSIHCDLSDFIVEQRAVFAEVIQMQTAYNVLRTLALNPDVRVNRNQLNATRDEILYELDGNGKTGSIGETLKNLYSALSISLQGLDRVCLSCHNGGVHYRAV